MPRLIVAGSGTARLFSALCAHRRGMRDIALVTRAALEDGATRYARDGIAAAVGGGDSWELPSVARSGVTDAAGVEARS